MNIKIFKKIGLTLTVMGLPFICGAIADEVRTHLQTEAVSQNKQDNLEDLIAQRLLIAQDFAKVHWNQNLPIDNLDNEKAYIAQLQIKAKDMGLDPSFVTSFFLAQYEAYKMIMIENFDVWVTQDLHKHDTASDQQVLQDRLTSLDDQILVSLKNTQLTNLSSKETFKASVAKDLQVKGFSREVIDSATHF